MTYLLFYKKYIKRLWNLNIIKTEREKMGQLFIGTFRLNDSLDVFNIF